MRLRSVLFLLTLLICARATPLSAQEPQAPSSPGSAPLSEEERREQILYIEKFILSVEAERLLRDAMKRQEELSAKERELAARELATSQKETQLALDEAAAATKRAEEFKTLYERAAKKQGGFGCFFRRLVFKPCRA